MRVLVIGGGGREHALVWKIADSPLVEKVFCAPGNAGIAQIAECIPLSPMDLEQLADFAEANRIDLTVVGPEAPLIAGIVDLFEARGLCIFGPSTDPARLEGSKIFAKEIMRASNIPTAEYWICDSKESAIARIRDYYAIHGPGAHIVVKADGIAAGKGVTVAEDEAQANAAVDLMMADRVFGAAGDRVVIEECLVGEEVSIMVITDGEAIVPLVPSQDHKRALDDDRGPNTGGMGAYSPVPVCPPDIAQQAIDQIVRPAIKAIRDLGIPYRGVLYAGIILTAQGLKAIEFNCRFGDPETQIVLPLLESDLVPLLIGVAECTLDQKTAVWRSDAAVTVVAASAGYPGDYEKGKEITGLEQAASAEGCVVFHSGTKLVDGRTVTDGGRVLSVTALGDELMTAAARAYAGLSYIDFEGMQYRRDIAARALRQ